MEKIDGLHVYAETSWPGCWNWLFVEAADKVCRPLQSLLHLGLEVGQVEPEDLDPPLRWMVEVAICW